MSDNDSEENDCFSIQIHKYDSGGGVNTYVYLVIEWMSVSCSVLTWFAATYHRHWCAFYSISLFHCLPHYFISSIYIFCLFVDFVANVDLEKQHTI